jgi:glycosyltransferase involved in cell wall biosynthesis
LISFLISTYSRTEGFERLLKSVLNQNINTDIEIIISDSNPDYFDTKKIFDSRYDNYENIIYYKHSDNLQTIDNYSFLLSKASGKYFVLMDDDDWLGNEDYIANCVDFLEKHPDYVIVSGELVYNENGKDLLKCSHNFESDFSYLRCLGTWNVNNMAVIYGVTRLDVALRVGFLQHLSFDRDYTAAVAYRGKIKTLENNFLYRSISDNSNNHKAHMERFGYIYRGILHFRFIVAIDAFNGVIRRKNIYGSIVNRLIVATSCFIVSLWCSFKLYWLNEKLAHLKYKFKKHRKRVPSNNNA